MARIDLRRVATCRRELDKAREALNNAIIIAVDSGEAQVDVARFAGLSQQRVSQIVKNRRRAPED